MKLKKEGKLMSVLLHVVVDNYDIAKQVTNVLLKNDISNVVVRRGIEVIDSGDERHINVIEDPAFNNLPLIVETVIDDEQLTQISPALQKVVSAQNGQINVIPGITGEEVNMSSKFVNMKYFIHPEERWVFEQNYEKVIQVLQKHHVNWATVTKGLAGYSANSTRELNKIDDFIQLTEHIPVIIEGIVPTAEVDAIIKETKPLFKDGIIFTTPINVVDENI